MDGPAIMKPERARYLWILYLDGTCVQVKYDVAYLVTKQLVF